MAAHGPNVTAKAWMGWARGPRAGREPREGRGALHVTRGSTLLGRLPATHPACASRHLGASTPPRPAACFHVRPQEMACRLAPSIRPGPTRQPLPPAPGPALPRPTSAPSCREEEHGSRHLLGRREFQFLAPARLPSCLQRVLPPPPEPAPLLPDSWPGDALMFGLSGRGLHTRSSLSCSCLPSPREARLTSGADIPAPLAPHGHQAAFLPPSQSGRNQPPELLTGRRPLSSRCSVRVLLASPPF